MTESRVESGELAQLQRHFQCIPGQWAMAAICRQAESGDASDSIWLRADPIHLQIEMRAARIMAWDTLLISGQHHAEMFDALRPVFGDAGLVFHQGHGGRFYIEARRGTPIPDFQPASEVLGSDLFSVLPEDRKWTALFNECQVILHNHPLNAERMRRGQPAVNGLWFWGQGVLPQVLRHGFSKVVSEAYDLHALAAFPGTDPDSERTDMLVDCRHIRDWSLVESGLPAEGGFQLDFSDGTVWQWQPRFKWWFWRRSAFGFN